MLGYFSWTHLGLETGFRPEEVESETKKASRAGMEQDIGCEGAPYIVKGPWFCDFAKGVISRDEIVVEHLFSPIRGLHAAAEGRPYVVQGAISKLPLIPDLIFLNTDFE